MICRGQKKCTRQKASLPSARKKHSAKTYFAVCFCLPSVFYLALGKHGICRVPDKIHSAKPRHSANRRFPVVRASSDPVSASGRERGRRVCIGQMWLVWSSRFRVWSIPFYLIWFHLKKKKRFPKQLGEWFFFETYKNRSFYTFRFNRHGSDAEPLFWCNAMQFWRDVPWACYKSLTCCVWHAEGTRQYAIESL